MKVLSKTEEGVGTLISGSCEKGTVCVCGPLLVNVTCRGTPLKDVSDIQEEKEWVSLYV